MCLNPYQEGGQHDLKNTHEKLSAKGRSYCMYVYKQQHSLLFGAVMPTDFHVLQLGV
jgi:hypothetical protein